MIDAALIDRARKVRIEDEITRRGIRVRGRVDRSGPCPRCGGVDRFSINIKKQVFHCRQCGGKGDVITFVKWLDGVEFRDAVEVLAGLQRKSNRSKERFEISQPEAEQQDHHADDDDHSEQHAARVWDEAIPILGTPGEEYLARRGINIADVPDCGGLRFHPRCPFPAVVARFTEVTTNKPRGIWRRPITGEKPKSLGGMGGCCIRLWPGDAIAQRLVIGEGVETVLAAATRIEHRGTLLQPAWACASAGNLERFPVLPGIERLTILVDRDESGTGERASAECSQRWRIEGREVVRLVPSLLGDFNDIVRE